ncbi:DUF45 domain-containing protein [Mycoplasma sp. NEAQ87857]|uniref:YgjP-like metallopeptidase domain-containing protein n=1 Tax=Mycoplasma sp. NEAQ87857 TaxID=2683967 RepID=UPI00131789A4|nr:YgjP-like metallopeptidase domain-containing protein [Mycoplasma sp. NEAQ87857]QGZ97290.1 DUF45 domain-containing protein [Mycoplasma sp. NEAQ87857]
MQIHYFKYQDYNLPFYFIENKNVSKIQMKMDKLLVYCSSINEAHLILKNISSKWIERYIFNLKNFINDFNNEFKLFDNLMFYEFNSTLKSIFIYSKKDYKLIATILCNNQTQVISKVKAYALNLLKQRISLIQDNVEKDFNITSIPFSFKDVSSYYGQYNKTKHKITYNKNIYCYNDQILKAIIAHEIVHSLTKNGHGKDFYNLLLKYMPNYKMTMQTIL